MNGTSRVGIAAFAAGAALFAAGCSSSDSGSGDSGAVVNPPAGATIGSSGSGTAAAPSTGPTSTAPSITAPASKAPSPTSAPPTTASGSTRPTVSGPAARYATVVGQWQGAQSLFLRQTTGGSASLSREHQWAGTFLSAERRFAAALVPSRWPAAAAGSLARLRRTSNQQQRTLRAMTQAAGPSDFTGLLGNYSTNVGTENRDVQAVGRALGR